MFFTIVPHRREVKCRLCKKRISFTEEVKEMEDKGDFGSYKLKWDYCEDCWAETI